MRKCLLHKEFWVVLRISQGYGSRRIRSRHNKPSLQLLNLFVLLKVHNFSIDVSFLLQNATFFLSFHVDSVCICQRSLLFMQNQRILIWNLWIRALVSCALLVHASLSRLPLFSLFLHEFEVYLVGIIWQKLAGVHFTCRVRTLEGLLYRLEEDCVTITSVCNFYYRCNRNLSLISLPLNSRIVLDAIAYLVLVSASTLFLILMKLCFNDNKFVLLLLFKLVKFFHFYSESFGSASTQVIPLINFSKYVSIYIRLWYSITIRGSKL